MCESCVYDKVQFAIAFQCIDVLFLEVDAPIPDLIDNAPIPDLIDNAPIPDLIDKKECDKIERKRRVRNERTKT